MGGTLAPADTSVFLLEIEEAVGPAFNCSATLISARTLLTAAHCLDAPIRISATNVANEANAKATDWAVTTAFRVHPQFAAQNLTNDFALALLPTASSAPRKPLNFESVTLMAGKPLRAVGYGATSVTDMSPATRRTVNLTFNKVTAQNIEIGNQVDKSICQGDSGGPSFHTFPDGVERLVGVHSYTDGDTCLSGGDARVDVAADFIDAWLQEKEPMDCAADGRCAPACASADPDCRALGAACTTKFECAGRLCVTDFAHPQAYCSTHCSHDSDCAPLRCDAALGQCTRLLPPAVTIDAATDATGAAVGCTSVPPGLGGLGSLTGMLAWLGRSQRRRRR